jgi:hypothetical protein
LDNTRDAAQRAIPGRERAALHGAVR